MKDNYVISWSGGKDSCLALHKAVLSMGMPTALLTMFIENGARSRSHGLRQDVVEAQSRALGIQPYFYATSWNDYEATFLRALTHLGAQGISSGVFGDIKIDGDEAWSSHRSWADTICQKADMIAHEPLWDLSLQGLERDFLSSGIEAIIVAAKDGYVDKKYLGQTLTQELFNQFAAKGVHLLGERGEYHTLVVNSPLFQHRLNVHQGQVVYRNGYWFLDVLIK